MRLIRGEGFSLQLIPNVFLLAVLLWITSCDVGHAAIEHVCRKSIDIRNDVKDFQKLEGCTVIEGSLQILLIDYAEESDYESLSFPLLREITDYLLLYRVYGLKSLGKIFPNLSVIRGQRLFYNYALVAFEMVNLEDIALPSLTAILRGGVRLEKNSNLCYVDTIDWSEIVLKAGPEDNFIIQNKDIDKCVNRCPRDQTGEHLCKPRESGSRSKSFCWNSRHCQLVCPAKCGENKACYKDGAGLLNCCHKECIGGCTGPLVEDCAACKNYFLHVQNRCVNRCPSGTYVYKDRRCITEKECQDMEDRNMGSDRDMDMAWKLFHNEELNRDECIRECPSGFTTDDQNKNKCKRCDGPCPKTCIPVPVDSVAAAQKLKGCTVIKGYLQIHITGGNRVGYELDENLGEIQTVNQYITVIRSAAIYSLHFLRQLMIIKGDALYNNRYALFVLDNQNLQEIWDWKVHPNLTIITGYVFFNQNRKLCLSKIDELVDQVGLTGKVDKVDISDINNGDQAACDMKQLKLKPMQVHHNVVIITWSSFKTDDERKLLHYVVYYREAPEQNITIWNARDACSNDVWKTMDVPPVDGEQDVGEIISGLKPFTQYAIYVQTYTIASAQQGAISPIVYFVTKPYVPTNPRNVVVQAKSPNELVVTWDPPSKPNGNVTHYYVYWQPQSLSTEKLDQRNYCVDKIHGSVTQDEEIDEEKEKMKMNVTHDGKYCCVCLPSDEESIAQENDRQFQIKFEDFLHASVYVKRPANLKDNDLPPNENFQLEGSTTTLTPARYRREVNGDHGLMDTRPGINSSFILGNLSLPNVTNNTYDNLEGNSAYHTTVVYGKTMVILSSLPHFTEYSIEVIACHEVENGGEEKKCSNRAITTGRTLPEEGADNVHHSNITITDVDNGVFIGWSNPDNPNGLIVTYELKYQQIGKDFQPVIKCLTHVMHRQIGGYKLTQLNPGNYSLSLRATSLAGNGSWTEPKFFVISPNLMSNSLKTEVIAAIAASVALITIFIVSTLIWYFAKKRFNAPPDRVAYASFNPEYQTVYVPDEWEVSRSDVIVGKELGQGSFGMVYEGIAKNMLYVKEEIKVAIKTVMEDATQRDRMEFLNEASVMKAFNCNHVVKLLGVVSAGAPTLVIMELMGNGDLKNYLRLHRPEENKGSVPPTMKEILKIAGEICDGMVYLSSKKFVHRDLAARNCMVAEDQTVKIGDFGMTRDVYETDYYRKGGKGLLPVRWMAPESLKDGRFTSQSDVWSFGVVLWEMATLAAQPYQGLSNEQVLNYVKDGGIMEQPVGCPDRLYEIMLECWRHNLKDRPTFCEILESLVPDLDESFKDDAYFFSEENQQERLMAKAKQDAIVIQTNDEEDEDEAEGNKDLNNDSYLPLTGSGQRMDKQKDPQKSHPPPEPLRLFKLSQFKNKPDQDVESSYLGVDPSRGSKPSDRGSSGYMSSNPSTSSEPPSYSASFELPHYRGDRTPHSSLYSHPTNSGDPPPPVSGKPSVGRSSPPNSRTLPAPMPPSPSKQKADTVSRSPSSDESKESSKSSGGSGYAPVNGMANGHLPRPYVARQAKC